MMTKVVDLQGAGQDQENEPPHEDTNDATNDHQRRLERLAAEFVSAKDSVESAVQYLKPRIQQILHRIRMAEIAINNLSEVADDITNLPTILKCLNVGQQRVAALEAKSEDALRAPPQCIQLIQISHCGHKNHNYHYHA